MLRLLAVQRREPIDERALELLQRRAMRAQLLDHALQPCAVIAVHTRVDVHRRRRALRLQRGQPRLEALPLLVERRDLLELGLRCRLRHASLHAFQRPGDRRACFPDPNFTTRMQGDRSRQPSVTFL